MSFFLFAGQKYQAQKSFTETDTNNLVRAISSGKGLTVSPRRSEISSDRQSGKCNQCCSPQCIPSGASFGTVGHSEGIDWTNKV